MKPLLAWSLRMLKDVGPDIVEAHRAYKQLCQGSHPAQAAFAGLPIRRRLAAFPADAIRGDPCRSTPTMPIQDSPRVDAHPPEQADSLQQGSPKG